MSKGKSNYLEPIAIGISGVVSSNTISIWQGITKSNILILILSGVTAVLVYEVIILLFNKVPKKFEWSRKLVDNRAAYEGYYLEIKNVHGIRTYAIVCVAYNPSTDDYQLSGTSVEINGTIKYNWKSIFLTIDTDKRQIIYAQTGQSTDTSNGNTFEGVTYMNFHHHPRRKLISGVGHYIDTNPAQSDFAFNKISQSETIELLGKKSIENTNDYILFVKKYHENKFTQIFSWEPPIKIEHK